MGLPRIKGLQSRKLSYTRPVFGTGYFIRLTVPDPRGSSWSYNNVSYSWTSTALQISVPLGLTSQIAASRRLDSPDPMNRA